LFNSLFDKGELETIKYPTEASLNASHSPFAERVQRFITSLRYELGLHQSLVIVKATDALETMYDFLSFLTRLIEDKTRVHMTLESFQQMITARSRSLNNI
jgi:hypothetical protein